jgi:hypothetical protein
MLMADSIAQLEMGWQPQKNRARNSQFAVNSTRISRIGLMAPIIPSENPRGSAQSGPVSVLSDSN